MSAPGTARGLPVAEHDSREAKSGRTPLAQLLHALNQPLTGLQCSLEVTLASVRTTEQYTKALRDGLILTERMRLLVEAVREVAGIVETKDAKAKSAAKEGQWPVAAELRSVLRETAEELMPVAEVKQVNIAFGIPQEFPVLACAAETRRSPMALGIFRLLESVVALAARGSTVRLEAVETWNGREHGESNGQTHEDNSGFRIRWRAPEQDLPALSRQELGLLAAQARLEHEGALWERERTQGGEVLTVWLASGASGGDRRG